MRAVKKRISVETEVQVIVQNLIQRNLAITIGLRLMLCQILRL